MAQAEAGFKVPFFDWLILIHGQKSDMEETLINIPGALSEPRKCMNVFK